jgi:hypothetical protein
VEQDIPELSHAEAGFGWSCGGDFQCRILVPAYGRGETDWVARVDTRPVSNQVISDARSDCRGGFMSSWLGKVGKQEDIQIHERQEA